MKYLLLFLLTQLTAEAANPLSFSARIQDATLAEEAIDLMHCIADKSGSPWELGLENAPAPRVVMKEAGGKLEGAFQREEGTPQQNFSLAKNEWRKVCGSLFSETRPVTLKEFPLELPREPVLTAKKQPWGWIAVGAAALAGGIIAWKTSQAKGRVAHGLTMN